MKLLVFAGSYGHTIGGGPVLAPFLFAALARRGHTVTVVTDDFDGIGGREGEAGVSIVRLPFRRALQGDFARFAAIRNAIAVEKSGVDVVHIFSHGRGDFFHCLTGRLLPLPTLVTLHDLHPPAQLTPEAMVGRNLRAAHRITACSRATLDWTLARLPEIAPRSIALLNAVPEPALMPIRVARGRLLFAGRLVPQKGCDLALDAVAQLVPAFPELTLDIAGCGTEQAALQAKAVRLGIEPRVNFLGPVPRHKLIHRMAASEMLLVPSRDEPFGLVALESAHAGRPVIAAAVGGLPEVVEHGLTGLVILPDHVQALADAIARLLRQPAYADQLGSQARERARTKFRFNDFVDRMEQQLLEVIH